MNDLWMLGFTGAMVGGALGWPLLRCGAVTSGVMGAERRALGVLLLLGAIATALIATQHGRLAPPRMSISLEHVLYGGNLVFWSLLTLWMRRATGLPTTLTMRLAIVVLPLAFYALLAATLGRPPHFVWLLPISIAGALYATFRAQRSRSHRGSSVTDQIVARLAMVALALAAAQSVRTFWPHVTMLREVVPLTMTAGFLSIAALAMRTLFTGVTSGQEAESRARKPYARSALDDAAAVTLLASLDQRMLADRWYCDPHLTLQSLAAKMKTTPHALSQALNQVDGRGLNEYLAAWRVDEARRLLLDPASAKITIDAVAEQAGFGSRSAFYKAFRAKEGVTPTEFRRRHH
jgi:AraC-like DNA-binding protein